MNVKCDITVHKINESCVKINCEPSINRELKIWFRARPENFRFMPQYKSGIWDGWVYYYKNNQLPIGLLSKLEDFSKKFNYSLYISFNDTIDIEKEELKKFIDLLELPFPIRDYQFNAVHNALCKKRINISCPTGSGKSLIQYCIARFMLLNEQRTIIVVPKINLVDQLFSDFVDYGWDNAWEYCSTVYGGKNKDFDKNIVISTWQTLNTIKKKTLFNDFQCLMIDESHHASATSLQKISQKCINANYRIGLSGTHPNEKTCDWFGIVGSLGPIKAFVSYQELREAKHIAGVNLKNIILRYSQEISQYNYVHNKGNYQAEVNYIYENPERTKFISKLASNLRGNSIILFTKITQGKKILEEITKIGEKKCLYISGETSSKDRELHRLYMEKNENVVLVASYGTFSEGANIKNIHNILCASSYKSKVKVLQSIGRGLRINRDKDECTIYDIIDDLSCEISIDHIKKNKYTCFSMKHFKARKKIYEEAGFDVTSTTIIKIK